MKKILLVFTILTGTLFLYPEKVLAYTWKPSCAGDECVGRQRDSDNYYACHTEGEWGALTLGEPENYYCRGSAGWVYRPDDDGNGGGNGGGSARGDIFNPMVRVEGVTALSNYLGTFWQVAYTIGGIMVLIFFTWGAISWLTASGNEEQIEKAQKTLSNALIGLVILAASFPIIKVIEIVFGINILNITWPTP
jgi:hypothetical protein